MIRTNVKASGGTDESDFRQQFTSVPKLSISSDADVKNKLEMSRVILEDTNQDWSKRVAALKSIRGVIYNGGLKFEHQLIASLNDLTSAFEISIKDLRSQVCREACITVSYAVNELKGKIARVGGAAFAAAFSLLGSSTKIMATSGTTLARFIIKFIHTKDVFSIIASMATSKSAAVRREMAQLLTVVVEFWDEASIVRHQKQIVELCRSSICDADNFTRTNGRSCYQKMEQKYPDIAKSVFMSLDATRQKTLSGASSAAGSTASLSDVKTTTAFNSKLRNLNPISSRAMTETQILRGFARPTTRAPSSTLIKNGRVPTQPKVTPSKMPMSASVRPYPIKKTFTADFGLNDDDDFLLPKRPNMPLEQVLELCSASSLNDKKEGVKNLQKHVEGKMGEADVTKVGEKVVALLADCSTTTFLPAVLHLTETLITNHHKMLSNKFIANSVSKLTFKHGSEMVPATKDLIDKTLRVYLATFDPAQQLRILCLYLTNPVTNQGHKAKSIMLRQVKELLENHTESGADFHTPEVVNILKKLFQFMEDEKNHKLYSQVCEGIITGFFSVNPSCFINILNSFDSSYRDSAFKILQKHGKSEAQIHSEPNNDVVRQSAAALNDSVAENILKFSNISLGSEQPSSSITRTPERHPIIPTMTSVNRGVTLGPIDQNASPTVAETKRTVVDDGNLSLELMDTTVHKTRTSDSQSKFISEHLELMKGSDPEQVNRALATILMMLYEGTFTLWDPYFHKLLLVIFEILDKKDPRLQKKIAIRVLNKMCIAQASRLFDTTEMAICKVIEAVVATDSSTLLIAAEDCLKTLATHLPLIKVVHCAYANISKQDVNDVRIALTLKMLTRVFEQVDEDEVDPIVDQVVPTIIKCYESKSASVRKCTVFCLVAIVSRLGQERMQPYLKTLNSTSANLIQVYVSRAKGGHSSSAHHLSNA